MSINKSYLEDENIRFESYTTRFDRNSVIYLNQSVSQSEGNQSVWKSEAS